MTPKSRYIFIVIAAVVLAAGCKKNTAPAFQKVNVELNSLYCPTDSVYAGTVYWETDGTFQSTPLTRENNSFVADISQFTKGAGTLSVQLYTYKQLPDYRDYSKYFELTYENRNAVVLSDENVTVDGPISLDDEEWNPRWLIKGIVNGSEKFTTIIGIRPDDPYFEIKNINEAWKKPASIRRIYYLDSDHQDRLEKTWTTDALENSINRNFFLSLNEDLQSGVWLESAAVIRIETEPNTAWEWSMFYTKP